MWVRCPDAALHRIDDSRGMYNLLFIIKTMVAHVAPLCRILRSEDNVHPVLNEPIKQSYMEKYRGFRHPPQTSRATDKT